MNQKELNEILERHRKWLNNEPDGRKADLREANLRWADLRGADLDYSCWPLWCGSLDVTVDRRIAAQLAYHFAAWIAMTRRTYRQETPSLHLQTSSTGPQNADFWNQRK